MAQSKNSPDYNVYTVIQHKDKKDFWQRVGSAWNAGDDGTVSIKLNALPVNGELVLRVPLPDEDE